VNALTCTSEVAFKLGDKLFQPASIDAYELEYDFVKVKASSLDIALTILDSGALRPPKWQLTGNDCSTAVQAVAAQSLR